MHIFFADDSTQKSLRDGMGKLIAFGGLLFPVENLREHTAKVHAICKEAGVPTGTELKWSPPPENWLWAHCKDAQRERLFLSVLHATAQAGARAVVTVWDAGRTTLKEDTAFDRAVTYTFERVSIHLANLSSHAIFVADRPGGGKDQDSEFLERFVEKAESGTEYVAGDRLVMNCLTTPSHLVRQLQVADLVVGITTAMVARKYKYASALFEAIRPMFITNTINGNIGGTGLKLCPNELLNLYFHVLREDSYYRNTTGVSLPVVGRPYEIE